MSEMLRPRAVIAGWKWWTGFFVIVGAGAALSVFAYTEGLPRTLIDHGADKVVHFTMGGLLAFFLDGALRRRSLRLGPGISIPLAAAIILVPAAIEEWAQRYSSNRSSSLGDFLADAAGVIVLTALSRRIAE